MVKKLEDSGRGREGEHEMGCEREGKMGGRCRIEFLNVQGLTVAKSVEIRNLMMVSEGDGCEREMILRLVETHEKFNRVEWGEDVEYPTSAL